MLRFRFLRNATTYAIPCHAMLCYAIASRVVAARLILTKDLWLLCGYVPSLLYGSKIHFMAFKCPPIRKLKLWCTLVEVFTVQFYYLSEDDFIGCRNYFGASLA